MSRHILVAEMRQNKRRMHMPCRMAGAVPTEYAFFAITAGPQTLTALYPIP